VEALLAQFADWGGSGVLLALFFGTFVSEDLACLSAGSLAASGRVDLAPAVAACFLGIFVGDMLLYAAGRSFGTRALDSRIVSRIVKRETIDRGAAGLRERGACAIFVSRFVSGLRLPTYLAAGAVRMDAKRFAIYIALAAAIWTPVLVGVAAVWQTTLPGGAAVWPVAALILFRYLFRLTNWKYRRLARGRVRRIVRWEFWPLWVFYAPVVVYVLILMLRHRGLTFTATNPSMPASGFVGESKDEIYKLIAASDDARPHLLRHIRIHDHLAPEDRLSAAERFISDNGLSYPLVVKPDAGERGDGVTVVHNSVKLKEALSNATSDVLVQEHFDGVEASIFYYRRPSEPRGRIFSITEKVFPIVCGDGRSTLEELILRDRRAYIIAKKYFDRNSKRLRGVPSAGEQVRLVDIGSHSKGAIFQDGEWLRTSELEAKIDEICLGIPGFHFGRFDIRTESFDDLKRGAKFSIIELNGVTSESTNIYDPRFSLTDAYHVLFAQWRLAFEIGSENIRRGEAPATACQLASLILNNKFPGRRHCNVRPIHRLS
jgi:membrane protein DedA with SNARE-associated domain